MNNVLIVGAGGIGCALADRYIQLGCEVSLISRGPSSVQNLTEHHQLNICELEQVENFFSDLPGLPDMIINTVGILHDDKHQPEKSIKQLEASWLQQSISVNVQPTINLAKVLCKYMKRSTALKLVIFSARVSSISDNRLGGWYSYRMSKCALNMLVKNIALEWGRTFPCASIFGYHPGTVDTRLSQPFQANIPQEKLFLPAQAASYFVDVARGLKPEQSGLLLDWEGSLILP